MKQSSLGVVSLGLIASLLLTSSAISVYATSSQASFGSTINLSSNTGSSEVPVVAAKGSNVYIAWEDDTSGKFKTFFRVSHDNGTSFGLPIIFSVKGTAHQVRIFAEGSSNVYLAWVQTVNGQKEIFFAASHDGGNSFNTAKGINASSTSGKSISPVIGAYGNNVYVAWEDSTSGSKQILFTVSRDSGNTFVKPNVVLGSGGEPELAVSQSNVYVIWAGTYIRVSHNNGTTFATAKHISTSCCSVGINREPKIAASGTNVYVTWPWNIAGRQPGNYEAIMAISHNSGDTFLAAVNLSNDPGPSREVEVDAYGSNVYATWWDSSVDGNREDQYVRASHDTGTTFDPVINLANNSGGEDGFGQVRSFGSNVYVVWPDNTPGNSDVFIASSQDSGATYAVQNLSNNAGTSLALGDPGNEKDAIAAVNNHIYVVWQDDTTGNNEVLFRAGTV